MVSFERVIRRRLYRQSADFTPKKKRPARPFHHMGSTRRDTGYTNPGAHLVRHNDGVPDREGKDVTPMPGNKYTPHYGAKETEKFIRRMSTPSSKEMNK